MLLELLDVQLGEGGLDLRSVGKQLTADLCNGEGAAPL